MNARVPGPSPADQQKSAIKAIIRHTRRLIIGVIGGTVVILGVLLLVLPGPGLAVIALGVAILAVEFAWAKRVLDRGKVAIEGVKRRFRPAERGNRNAKSGNQDTVQEKP
jgi:tellurite resistance protein TerC